MGSPTASLTAWGFGVSTLWDCTQGSPAGGRGPPHHPVGALPLHRVMGKASGSMGPFRSGLGLLVGGPQCQAGIVQPVSAAWVWIRALCPREDQSGWPQTLRMPGEAPRCAGTQEQGTWSLRSPGGGGRLGLTSALCPEHLRAEVHPWEGAQGPRP